MVRRLPRFLHRRRRREGRGTTRSKRGLRDRDRTCSSRTRRVAEHAELQAKRAARSRRESTRCRRRAADDLVRRARCARTTLGCVGALAQRTGQSRVLGGLTSLLRAQRSSRGGRVLRWVVDSVAVVESGDEAFVDEFFGSSLPWLRERASMAISSESRSARAVRRRSVASTPRRRARTWRPAASNDGPRAQGRAVSATRPCPSPAARARARLYVWFCD